MSRKALIVLTTILSILLAGTLISPAASQTLNTGRVMNGPFASRPTCGAGAPNAGDGDIWNDTDDVNTYKCSGAVWSPLGGGGAPAGVQGDVQIKGAGSNFAAGGENDDGTNLKVSRDLHTKGPNPWVDITMFGARATPFNSMPQTTATTTATSATITVASGAQFVNGDGIVIRGAGAANALATPVAPTVVPSSAVGPTGTGQDAAAPAGALTNQYCVAAVDIGGAMSPCSPVTSVATANTLGAQSVGVTSWTAGGFSSGSNITVTTSAPHTMVVGTYIQIGNINDGSINGFWKVDTVPDNTHFTFLTANMVAMGLPASGGSGATVYYWNSNHITWPEITNAVKYYVYGRTAGAMALIGVTTLQISTMCNSCIGAGNPGPPALVANMFDDYGATMTQNISNANVPDYVPVAPPVAAKNRDFVALISSGAGTTTIVLSGPVTSSVAGATMKIDNSININLAMNAASLNGSATQGVVYIPATGAQGKQFETNSPLQMYSGSIGTISFVQAGQLNLGDMLWTQGGSSAFGTKVNWQGFPNNPNQGLASFARSSAPVISSSRATPMIYSANKNWYWKNLNISNSQPNQGFTWIADQGGGIPGSAWENIEMDSHGSNDYMIIHFLMRGDSNGGADFQFNHFAVLSGPGSQAPGVTTTPAFYGDGMPSPIMMSDVNLSLRTFYFRMLPQGIQLTIDKIYDEGGIEPMVGAYFTGGSAALNLSMNGVIADTMGAPMLSLFGVMSGNAKVVAWTSVGSQQPFTSMPNNAVAVVGAGPTFAYGTATANGNPTVSQAQDGVMNSSMGAYAVTHSNSSYSVPNVMQHFVRGDITTPACAISAGGTAPIQQWAFRIAPVFRNGSTLAEGTYGQTVFCNTTAGQQTATVTWPAISGAVGYDFAENNNVVNCTPNNQGGNVTQYIRNNANPTCGFPIGSTGGGVTSMGRGGLSGVALRLNNNFTTTIQPSAVTANRTQTTPDASGTFLLDTTTTTSAGLAPAPYDNFFRANGGLGANWTTNFSGSGSLAIASNAVVGGNAGSFWTGSYWSVTPFLNDQYAEVTIASLPTGGGKIGPSVRNVGTTAGTTNNYACVQDTASIVLEKTTSGGVAFMTSAGDAPVVGMRIRLQQIGTALTCTATSPTGVVTTITSADAANTSGAPGITAFQATGTVTNFTGGSIPNNVAYVTSPMGEQQFNGDQHINNGALIIGNYPYFSDGSLTNNQIYSQGGYNDFSITSGTPVCVDPTGKHNTSCPSQLTAPVSDNFNRANGALGASWQATLPNLGYVAPTITTNAVRGNTASTNQEAIYVTPLGTNQFAQVSTPVNGNVNSIIGLGINMSGSGATAGNTVGYFAFCNNAATSQLQGNTATLATFTCSYLAGDVFRLENLNGVATFYKNGTPIATGSAASLPIGGYAGIYLFGNNAGAVVDDFSAGPLDTILTEANTKTLTNKTIDAEAAGNLITIPFKPWFGAALCNNVTAGSSWSLPTAAAPTPNCNTGTNVQEGTLDFADTNNAQYVYQLPSDWTGAIDAKLIFFNSSTTGTVIWQIATACTAVGGTVTDDTAFNTPDSFATITLNTPANALWQTTKTGINTTGCSAGNSLQLKLIRTTDTAVNVARLKGLELTVRRTM